MTQPGWAGRLLAPILKQNGGQQQQPQPYGAINVIGGSVAVNSTTGDVDLTIPTGVGVVPNSVLGLRSLVATASRQLQAVDVYSTPGDNGGGTFFWNSTDTRADDGGTIIAVTGVATGRWNRVYTGRLNPRWFGVKGDGVTNDSTALALSFATGGRGAYQSLDHSSYSIGSGSVGLAVSNHNTWISGAVTGEDTSVYSAAPGGTSGPGAALVYSGTGVAVQVGSSTAAFTRNCRLEDVAIQCAENTSKGLYIDGTSYCRMYDLAIFGQSGTSNAGLYLAACVSGSIERLRVNMQGTQTNPDNYGVGVWAQSGVPTTTTTLRDCEIHLCYRGAYINTAYLNFDNCAIESCLHGLWAGPSANIRAKNVHFENNGGAQAGDGLCYASMVDVEATSSSVTIEDPIVVMYPGQYIVADVQGTGTLKVSGGTFAGGAVANVTAATNASPIQITTDSKLYVPSGFEVTIAGIGGNTAANGTFTCTRVDDQNFTLNGTTGNGAYTSGGVVQAIPYLHNGSSETANSKIEWDGPTLITVGGGAPWRLQLPASRAVTGDVLNYRNCRFPKLLYRTYRFAATAIAANASINPQPNDGYAGGNYVMPDGGFVLGMTSYYSGTVSAGTIQIQGVLGATAVIDSGAVGSLPDYRARGVFSVPVAKGDKLSCFCQTAGFAATGGDLEVEILVGFGPGTF